MTSTIPTILAFTMAAERNWKSRAKKTGLSWGKVAIDKGTILSDRLGNKVNSVAAERCRVEAFWPVTGDFPAEMDKAARILKAFTHGIAAASDHDEHPKHAVRGSKVIYKIPAKVIRDAKGLAIFTSMRTGIAPFGGAGGSGVVIARLPDGSWSGPSSITPNNLSAGFMLGIDVYDCVMVIRSQQALDAFATHRVTIGGELGVAAGPYGSGIAVESGVEKAPLLSYIRSRGAYAGVELVGQVFIERFDENAAMYNWPGIKAGDILSGRAKTPIEAANLHRAIRECEESDIS